MANLISAVFSFMDEVMYRRANNRFHERMARVDVELNAPNWRRKTHPDLEPVPQISDELAQLLAVRKTWIFESGGHTYKTQLAPSNASIDREWNMYDAWSDDPEWTILGIDRHRERSLFLFQRTSSVASC